MKESFISDYVGLFKPQVLIIVVKEEQQIDKVLLHRFLEQENLHIEIFKTESLQFNVLKHDLVPEHILLKEYEKQEILSY